MRFVIKDSVDGKTYVILKGDNGETLMSSETYEDPRSARELALLVKNRASEADVVTESGAPVPGT